LCELLCNGGKDIVGRLKCYVNYFIMAGSIGLLKREEQNTKVREK